MKRFLFVGLLAFVGCELTESTPDAQVASIFTEYSIIAHTNRGMDKGFEIGKDGAVFTIQSWEKGRADSTIIFTTKPCSAENVDGCAVVACPADSARFKFCNVVTWGADSVSFTYADSTLKGRYFK